MDDLIPVVNKLQDVFALVGGSQISVDLPQIVVIGAQSSGKSSVLENIVGRDFLPRGAGIVTRRPLVLQLVHNKVNSSRMGQDADSQTGDEYGEFLHLEGRRFYNFDEIREEIDRETDRLTGKNKGISDQPIRLRITSPHVVNLTMVDLPGITKVPVGDQPHDIEHQIRRMALSFISNPNSIVLAVSPANTDLANSDALKLAREVDPLGMRTVGVITKLDLMDAGTDAMETLLGRVIPLRLGFIGVVNRSQQDINNRKDIRKSVQDEAAFFLSHPSYRSIASKMGTLYLSRRLNNMLLAHIREVLPDIRSRVTQSISVLQTELAEYGDPVLSTKANKGAVLLQLLTKYASMFCDSIDGKSKELSTTELYGGARVNFIFNDVFPHQLEAINPVESLSVNDIRTAIRNATGTRQTLFVPEVSFELLAKQQIARLEDPALRCCNQVYDEMIRIVSQCQPKEMKRFANLRDRVVDVASGLLTQALEPTKKMVADLIQIELAYINTSHPDFVGGSRAVTQLMERRQDKPKQSDEAVKAQNQPTVDRSKVTPPAQPTTAVTTANGANSSDARYFSSFFGSAAPGKRPTARAPSPQRNLGTVGDLAPMTGLMSQKDMLPAQLRAQTTQLTEHERVTTEIIMTLLQSYFAIVQKNIQDSVPKAIMHFLVNHAKDSLQHQLVATLYREDMIDELLEEGDQIAQRRNQCIESMKLLKSAMDILNQVKDASYK